MFFLDSCVCIGYLRGGAPSMVDVLRASRPSEFGIPAIVEAELRTGVEKSARRQREMIDLERFLAAFRIYPFDSVCAAHYGQIRAELERSGRVIGPNDLLVAATARAYGATLITDNIREFVRVPGLIVESWASLGAEGA